MIDLKNTGAGAYGAELEKKMLNRDEINAEIVKDIESKMAINHFNSENSN